MVADQGWRRRTAAAAFAFWATMLGTTLPTPLYGLYTQRLGLTALLQTTVFATYAVGVIVALISAGQASDRFGRRPVLAVGLGAAAASAVVFLLPVSVPGLLTGRVLSGLSAGLFTGAATALVAELVPHSAAGNPAGRSTRTASLVATAANIGGLGSGPLLAGAVAQLGWAPLVVPYVLHLVLLALAGAALAVVPETVTTPRAQRPPWRPLRPAVPPQTRAAFVPAAVSGFAGFACLGLYSAAEPRVLSQLLGVSAPLAAGAVAALIFAASVSGQVVTASLPPARVLPAGCAALLVGTGLLAASLELASLPLLLLATVVLGAAQGACFRAGVAEVGASAPPQRRAEVVSTLFVVFYVAISLPVVGVGALADTAGLRTAVLALAGLVSVLAVAALVVLLTRRRRA
ncbi:Predicted arabinose efflux permease, MFS family [Quadrisphaera granulorum]|uniref:Putative MFS family arabinose efflux permease n=1 Tax=Quadrisphaera granulorum TaxID=317664 RepID=A0A316AAP9_9ACTN|nr:MFS transporter [Quadrisphaera granulorum]PWJ54855.1 putative MFS family arabinose efflux permease [Quadrisphaera granulorum]SZE95801.1 Predicted arabinose efflux permease, MFS family [Quadrisphaera granulorum]